LENPQIEVNEIDEPDANAQIVAQSMADWLEKGGRAKRVGYTYLRRIKEAGIVGAEIEITGKLSGNRGRTEKFSFGYVKRCGNTSKENVEKGYKLARTKPGAIGVKVRLMKDLPEFMHRNVDVEKELLHEVIQNEEAAAKADRIEDVIAEAENMTSSEIERAIEELEEVKTDDIERDEVRDVFENEDRPEESEEETQEADESETNPMRKNKNEDESEAEEQEADNEEESEEQTDSQEVSYDEIVDGTIGDAKDQIGDLENPDYQALLEAEEDNKARTTFIDWLENKKE